MKNKVVGGVCLAAVMQCAGQACTPDWTPVPHSGIDGAVLESILFDTDGPGPLPERLVIGGDFGNAGGVQIGRIAVWNGEAWEPVGGGLPPGRVRDLAVFDEDGAGPNPAKLAAAGGFAHPTLGARGVAIFDGNAWVYPSGVEDASSAGGLNGQDPGGASLYIGAYDGVYVLGGGAMAPVGAADGYVGALAFFDEDGPGPRPLSLFAGGEFTTIGGLTTRGIARYDAGVWTAVGGGLPGRVNALHVLDPDGAGALPPALVAGGRMEGTNGVMGTGAPLLSWDGSMWAPTPGWIDGEVLDVADYDFDGPGPLASEPVVVGHSNSLAGQVFRRSGGGWVSSAIGLHGRVWTAAGFDPDGAGPVAPTLFAGGQFKRRAALSARFTPYAAMVVGDEWTPLADVTNEGTDDSIYAVTVHRRDGAGSAGYLVAGGDFREAGEQPADRIAGWDPSGWSPVGFGFVRRVEYLTESTLDQWNQGRPTLIACLETSGALSPNIYAWDGSGWASMPGPTRGFGPRAIVAVDHNGSGVPTVYAAGETGEQFGQRIMRWNAGQWVDHSGPDVGSVYAAAAYDPDAGGPEPESLVIGGSFSFIGGSVNVSNIGRWDGASWHAMPGLGGVPMVHALGDFDEDGEGPNPPRLFAGGSGIYIGNVPSGGLVRWDGSAWSAVLSSVSNAWLRTIEDVEVFDADGPGGSPPMLYFAGWRTDWGPMGTGSIGFIGRFDGQTWTLLDDHVGLAVYDLQVFDEDGDGPGRPGLYVGGDFLGAGGHASAHLTRWGCPGAEPCYANCDLSTAAPVLNVADFTCFLQRFAGGHAYANCDGSTSAPVLNVADFTCFLQRFAAGCD